MFIDGSKFHEQVLKRVTQGIFVWNYFKIWQAVSEEKNFSEVHTVQQASTHGSHVFRQIKISHTIFGKGNPRNNPAKLFRNLTSSFIEEKFWKISLKSTQWKKPPPMVAIFFDGSNIRQQCLKRVTQGTILWNYSEFWPAVSEKKIFYEFLHVHIVQKVSP